MNQWGDYSHTNGQQPVLYADGLPSLIDEAQLRPRRIPIIRGDTALAEQVSALKFRVADLEGQVSARSEVWTAALYMTLGAELMLVLVTLITWPFLVSAWQR